MRILIRFGDNDFGNELRVVGWALRQAPFTRTCPPTHEQVRDLFNTLMPRVVDAYRTLRQMTGGCALSYFEIDVEHVYIGQEADEQMQTHNQWGNYDALLVDLDTGFVGVV